MSARSPSSSSATAKPLLRYVARRFRPELAEDAVQEALLSAHRALIGGTRPADVRAWLSTIAWRRALDLARRERDALPLDAGVAAKVARRPRGARDAGARARPRRGAMSELPERQLTALKLSALEGRSLEEIGDALDVGAGHGEVARRPLAPDAHAPARGGRPGLRRGAGGDGVGGRARRAPLRRRHPAPATAAARARGRTARSGAAGACALLIPFGLIWRTAGMRDKLRDLIAFNPMWEAQARAAKMCTAACLTAVGTGAVAAPTVTVAVPLVVKTATPTPMVAQVVPAKKKKTAAQAEGDADRDRHAGARDAHVDADRDADLTVVASTKQAKLPSVAMAGSGESAPTVVKPEPTPTPEPTPVATPTPEPPAATPPPVETPVATPTG